MATAACKFSTSELQKVVRSLDVFNILSCERVRPTAACKFSTSELLKVVRTWCVLYILTDKCASRHSRVQIFMSQRNSYLRTGCFNEPTFRLSRTRNHWKNIAIRDFPNISRVWIFFLLTLLSSDSTSLLCFSFLHIVGS